MEIVNIKVKDIIPYENNPRLNDEAVQYVANSIKEFGFKVPIIIDKNNVIVAGHTRLKSAELLGLKEVPCIRADDLTDQQAKAFRLADNKVAEFASWNYLKLDEELADITFDMTEFGFDMDAGLDIDIDTYSNDKKKDGALNERFIVPPFSVLDTRQGYWQDRKRMWLEKTGNLSETRDGEYGTFGEGMLKSINGGTSNFDPVLAETMYKWFCPAGGTILDPFGGEQTKGIVAGECGFKYNGVEIREEQVRCNYEKVTQYKGIDYFCGDSNNIGQILQGKKYDMMFTSPPYYDLEVYSKDDLSSLGTYEEFMEQYRNIFQQCYELLDDDTFAVIKVGEIRNKKTGEYRSFVADTIDIFRELGFKYYNEIILLNAVGTLRLRAGRSMQTRKVGKVHQNVLVFYKGKLENISQKFPPIDFSELEEEGEDGDDKAVYFSE